jgi:hypothetical protein
VSATFPGKKRKACAGAAAVEFALVLPFLLLLMLGVYEFARALQAQMILTNVSREGASLASRSSLEYTNQQIMNSLASSTPPLIMGLNGMLYITKVTGHLEGSKIRNVVIEQYRWAQGWHQNNYAPHSGVWMCGDSGGTRWLTSGAGDGSCSNLPTAGTTSPTANVMTGQLADGDVIYAVEAFYRFSMLLGAINFGFGVRMPSIGPDLYAMTVL